MLENKQAIVNHVRNKYESMEEYYLESNGISSPPICSNCGVNRCKFISIFKGYRNYCKDCHLSYFRYKQGNDLKRESISEYRESESYAYYINHIFDNIEEYKNIKFPYYDKFLKKEIKRFVVLDTKDVFLYRVCLVTGKEYKYELINHDEMANYISYDKKAVFIRNHVKVHEVIDIINNITDIEALYKIQENNKYCLKLIECMLVEHSFKKLKSLIFEKRKQDKLSKMVGSMAHYNVVYNGKSYSFTKSIISSYKSHYIDITDIIGDDILTNTYRKHKCVTCDKDYFNFKVKFYHKDNTIKVSKIKNVSDKSCGGSGCYIRGKGAWEYDEKRKKNISDGIKERIKKTSYTPPNNRNTYKGDYVVDDIKMRSSWEVIFYLYNKFHGVDISYEVTRIYYGKHNKVYVIDFTTSNTLYEVKPSNLLKNEVVKEKIEYAVKYASENGLVYKIITENELSRMLHDDKVYNFIVNYDILSGKSIVIKAINGLLR